MKASQICVSKPCKLCPFRRDVVPYIQLKRVEEIWREARLYGEHFVCHETVNYDEPARDINRRACAGFMILAKNEGIDDNLTIVQLADRLAGITFDNLRGSGTVYPSVEAMLAAYRRNR